MIRPRRLRVTGRLREIVREHQLNVTDLIYPIFVKDGKGVREPILSMPGQFRFSIDTLAAELQLVQNAGISSVLFFGLTDEKDEQGTASYREDGVVQQAIKLTRKQFPELIVMTDVCVCAYTTHGHCGIIHNDYVQNDETLEVLTKMAVSHARAGAHVVAPSAMMDRQVASIRLGLDETGFRETLIMAYSAKYLSSFYGPFREAANSAPSFGDRATYQMDVANAREAVREIKLDVGEGADMVMVKPALAYLDVVQKAREICDLPIVCYNVSGEYSMIKAAAEKGWIDEKKAILESLLSMKRAGADLIITYFAKQVAPWLNDLPTKPKAWSTLLKTGG